MMSYPMHPAQLLADLAIEAGMQRYDQRGANEILR